MSLSFEPVMFSCMRTCIDRPLPVRFPPAGLWTQLFVFGALDRLPRSTQSIYLMSESVDLCSRLSFCGCVFVEMGIFVLMKNAESQLNK